MSTVKITYGKEGEKLMSYKDNLDNDEDSGNDILKGIFWGTIISSAFWLGIIWLVFSLAE